MLLVQEELLLSMVDKVVDRHGTREVATAYLQYLYTLEGQQIAAKYNYRPSMQSVAYEHADKFPTIEMLAIDEVFGGWHKAQKRHFADGGTFDGIYRPGE